MRTYSMQLIDDSQDISQLLPKSITTLDEAIEYVKAKYPNKGKIRLCEHQWNCVSTTPYLVSP